MWMGCSRRPGKWRHSSPAADSQTLSMFFGGAFPQSPPVT